MLQEDHHGKNGQESWVSWRYQIAWTILLSALVASISIHAFMAFFDWLLTCSRRYSTKSTPAPSALLTHNGAPAFAFAGMAFKSPWLYVMHPCKLGAGCDVMHLQLCMPSAYTRLICTDPHTIRTIARLHGLTMSTFLNCNAFLRSL